MRYIHTNTNRGPIIIGISVAILLGGLGYLHRQQQQPEFSDGTILQADAPDSEASQMDLSQLSETQIKSTDSAPTEASGRFIRQGILLTSDNPTRGNLMLKTPTSNFYFHTARDYSALIGKSVTATAHGTIEQFSLTDIIENK